MISMSRPPGAVVFLGCLFLISGAFAQENEETFDLGEFSFDLTEFEKSPWTVDGHAQGEFTNSWLDQESIFTRLNFLGEEIPGTRSEGEFEVQAGLSYQAGSLTAKALGKARQGFNPDENPSDAELFEGYVSWQPGSNSYFTLGKSLLRWGKGYAWNPTNFAGREKNPSDPDLALAGYWMGQVEYVKSFSSALRTLAFTGAVLPVSRDLNSEFSARDELNLVGKLYLLWYDTDLDFVARIEKDQLDRLGLTFARNLTVNFEIHGEAARMEESPRTVLSPAGVPITEERAAWNSLAGIRYLTTTNTTLILEYYHNGSGYSSSEIQDFFQFTNQADEARLAAIRPDLGGYSSPYFMRNYLYLKASQKEPFGWLYITPAVFTIVNTDDRSYSLTPELAYTGFENLELRTRVSFLVGGWDSEFGSKVNDWKLEIRARWYF